MSRKKRLLCNTIAGVMKQIVALLCGFVLPRFILLYYGSAVNGLISSINHYLDFIYLLDLGVGSVVIANLYKPLADNDNNEISKIVKSSERFFRKLACIFIGYIIVLCFLFPRIVDNSFDAWYTISLLIIISISSLAQYMFGMTYQLLLTADQRAYIQLTLHIGTLVLNTVLSVVLMSLGFSIQVVKLTTAVIFVLRPIGQMIYVKKHYKINRRVILTEEPIKQKWNGFSQHFAFVVCQNIDVAVLTLFSTLENVSIYSVYFAVTHGVEQFVMTATNGLESLFGNMIAKGEKEELINAFDSFEWLIHTIVSILFTIAGITIVPFVSVFTKGITDTDYIAPVFGALMVIAYASRCLRIPYFVVVKAAGRFKETQNGAFISAVLNIVITIILVHRFGLIGAALGTFIAMFYHTCYFVVYLRRHILNRSVRAFIQYIFTDSFVVAASYFLTRHFVIGALSYGAWFSLAVKVATVVVIISAVLNLLLYKDKIKSVLNLAKSK